MAAPVPRVVATANTTTLLFKKAEPLQDKVREHFKALCQLGFYLDYCLFHSNKYPPSHKSVLEVITKLKELGSKPLWISWTTSYPDGKRSVDRYPSTLDREIKTYDPLLWQVNQALLSLHLALLQEDPRVTGEIAKDTMAYLEKKTKKRKSKSKKGGDSKRAKHSLYDDSEALITDPESPLFEQWVNIKLLLQHPRAREILLAKGIDPSFVEQAGFATSAARYQEDGRAGRYDQEWRQHARLSSERRTAGEYEEYLEHQYRREWEGEGEENLATGGGLATAGEEEEE